MTGAFCEVHQKDSYRTYGAAASAAQHCNRQRDAILRVYYDSQCCTYHLSSRVNHTTGAVA